MWENLKVEHLSEVLRLMVDNSKKLVYGRKMENSEGNPRRKDTKSK